MKKLFILIACFISIYLNAKQRTISEAQLLAHQFINTGSGTGQRAPKSFDYILLSHIQKVKTPTNDSITTYFAFNKGENNGFIIVSGDDRAISLLGYADEGRFDTTNLPDNLLYWLNSYNTELLSLYTSNPLKTTTLKLNEVATQASVAPLLASIKWNQSAPYNNLCPLIPTANTIRAVTGCVATGMAQVMMYYKWPVTGAGSNTYTSRTHSITSTVNFSTTNYDWANMTSTYSSTSTAIQNTAVATLMNHCGVAVNMDYGESSSASTSAMAQALKNNFGYDQNMQRHLRNYYDRTEWKNMLTAELNASRPVLYSGDSNDGGHLFVCDGYDSNGLFHFNWGWGGTSNGYFQISALDPSVQGIGGSTGGYNMDQEILVGVRKPSTSTPTYIMYTTDTLAFSAKTVARNSAFIVSATRTYNRGLNTFGGSLGFALYNQSGLVSLLKSNTVNLAPGYGYSPLSLSNLTIPSIIAVGNYKIYMVYKANTESNWQIVRAPIGTPNYINLEISATELKFSTASNVIPELKLNSFTKTGNLYQNKLGRFNISITNTGTEYNSDIAIYLESTNNQTVTQLVSTEAINIAAGETRVVDFVDSVRVAPGKYYLAVMHNPANNPEKTAELVQLGNYQLVDVLAEPTGTPTLSLVSAISFPNSLQVDKKMATLTAVIKNTSGFYDKKLIAFIYETTGGGSLTYLGYQDAVLDANETRTFKFTGEIDLTLKNYKTAVYYQNTSNAWTLFTPSTWGQLTFTLVDLPTSIDSPIHNSDIVVFPNPVIDLLKVTSTAIIKNIKITDTLGRTVLNNKTLNSNEETLQVSFLQKGSYILRIETAKGFEIKKFNKF